MIRITRFFYIHILVLPLILAAFVTGSPMTFFISYGVVLIHELFHLFAAILLGVKVHSIIVMPFGMTLRLSPALVREPKKEIAVALSGPFSNALMLILGLALFRENTQNLNCLIFLVANFACLALNLLPVLPLDGGRVLRALVISRAGLLPAAKFMRKLSIFVIFFLFLLGVILLIASRSNPSLVMIGAFLLYSLADEKKNSDILAMQLLLHEKEKSRKNGVIPTRHITVHKDTPAKLLLKKLNFSTFYLITVLSDPLSVLCTVTESDLIRAITQRGYAISMETVVLLKTQADTKAQIAKAYHRILCKQEGAKAL